MTRVWVGTGEVWKLRYLPETISEFIAVISPIDGKGYRAYVYACDTSGIIVSEDYYPTLEAAKLYVEMSI